MGMAHFGRGILTLRHAPRLGNYPNIRRIPYKACVIVVGMHSVCYDTVRAKMPM